MREGTLRRAGVISLRVRFSTVFQCRSGGSYGVLSVGWHQTHSGLSQAAWSGSVIAVNGGSRPAFVTNLPARPYSTGRVVRRRHPCVD